MQVVRKKAAGKRGNPVVAVPATVRGVGIQGRIAATLPSLTASQRRMADFVSTHIFRAATMRIDEFAQATAMSTASANRFAHALGFDGYPQFRASLMKEFEATLAPTERLRASQSAAATSREMVLSALDTDIENLQSTRNALTEDVCQRAVTALLEADRVFTIGCGTSGHLAAQMEYGLSPYCRDVRSLSSGGGAIAAARRLYDLSARDVVVAIAFPRYVSDTIALAKLAHDQGACVLALTDGPTSPLAPLADVALYLQAYRRLAANSDAVVLSVIQALCGAVAHRSPEAVRVSARMTESTLPWLHNAGAAVAPQPGKSRRHTRQER